MAPLVNKKNDLLWYKVKKRFGV